MEKISDIINNIANQFSQSMSKNHYTHYISVLDNAEDCACCFSELIAIKYNKCILLDKFRQADENKSKENLSDLNEIENKFKENLSDLNSLLLSSIVDDGSVSDEFYFNIAKLNFKVHDCKTALLFLDKSIRHEMGNVDSNNLSLRYDKRCLKGYCLEYIALTEVKKLETAQCVTATGGIKIGSINRIYDEVFEFLIGKKISEFSNRADEIIPPTVALYKKKPIEDILQALYVGKGFLYDILNTYKPILIRSNSLDEFNKKINELAHILAHCLSEYCKAVPVSQKKGRTNLIYFARLSDVLMYALGDKFISCYATLKVEKNEYFNAIDQMFSVKNSMQLCLNDFVADSDEYASLEREIAQLNFYIWYFSFITKIKVDTDCKEHFFEYCEKYKDSTASTYYYMLDFKEKLTDAFSKLKYNMLRDSDIDSLKKCKDVFDKNKPDKTVHLEINDEYQMLNLSYDVLTLSYRFIVSGFNDAVALHKLHKNMAYSMASLQKQKSQRCNNKVHGIWRVSVGAASFIYKGNISVLENELTRMSAHSNRFEVYNGESYNSLLQEFKRANVLVFIREETFESDIDFISQIVQYDERNNDPAEHHNIFIDISELRKSESLNEINRYISTQWRNAKDFAIRDFSIHLCLMFSMIEECWNKLIKPIEAYVISPVESTESYSYQDCSLLMPLSYEKFYGFTTSSIFNKWRESFRDNLVACYMDEKMRHRRPKQLNKDFLSSCAVKDKIKHIVYLEAAKDESIIYAFDFQDEKYISDGISVGDENGTSELQIAIESIYKDFKRNKPKNHIECSEKCVSICNAIDINNSVQYRTFRDYLYSYVGVMLDQYVYVLLRGARNQLEKTDYILCIFDGEVEINYDTCHCLRQVPRYLVDYEMFTKDSKELKNAQELVVTESSDSDINSDKKDPEMLKQVVLQLFDDEETKLKNLISECDETIRSFDIGTFVYKLAEGKKEICQKLIDYYLEIKTKYEVQKERAQGFIDRVKHMFGNIYNELQTFIGKISKLKATKRIDNELNKIIKEWETFIVNIKWEIE